MSKLKCCLILTVVLLLFVACQKDKPRTNAKYEIDISKGFENGIFKDLFINNRYIQLETTEESLFGTITKIYISKNRIYILDQVKTRGVFVFDKNGNFINKISRIGNGPGEYGIITDFLVQENEKKITLLANGRKLVFLDLDGNFISERKIQLPHCSFILTFKQDKFAFLNLVSAEDKYLVYFANNEYEINAKHLETPKGWEKIGRLQDVTYSGFDNEKYLFSHVCSSIIYEINDTKVYPKYNFIISGKVELTAEVIQNLNQLDEESFVMKTFDYFSFDSFFDLKDKLFVEFSIKNNKYRGLYNKKDKTFNYFSLKNEITPIYINQISENQIVGYLDVNKILQKDSFRVFNGFKIKPDLNPIIVISEIAN